MSNDTTEGLVDLYDWYWRRFPARVEGMDDDEYFWEPVPNCWTVRPAPPGGFVADFERPEPTPTPITTIAWRMTHLDAQPSGQSSGMAASGLTPEEYVASYFAPDGAGG